MTSTLDPILFDESNKGNKFEFVPEPFLEMTLMVQVYRNGKYAGSCSMSLKEWREQYSIEEYVELFNSQLEWMEGKDHV